MNSLLLLTISGIAVLDSLNPSLFIGAIFLLTTPYPTTRTMTYILGILLVNFLSGILILGGLRTILVQWLDDISP